MAIFFGRLFVYSVPYLALFQETEIVINQTAAASLTLQVHSRPTEWILMKYLSPSAKLLLIFKTSA